MILLVGMSAYAQETETPSMELLEFLGEGIKVEDEVVDPLTWQAMQEMTDSKQATRQDAND